MSQVVQPGGQLAPKLDARPQQRIAHDRMILAEMITDTRQSRALCVQLDGFLHLLGRQASRPALDGVCCPVGAARRLG
jgi:hypothetical protein